MKRQSFYIITNQVAVKILEKSKIVDVADVERVSREIHILKIVRHPQVVQLYEIIETQRKLYLIMEFASGGELFDYIVQHQRVKEKEACRFFQQIIAGVEYISRLNIVHRDLKPENLLLDYDKGIKLVDFGLSNTYKTGELLKTACGSPCYAAPEMIAGKKYHGTNVDIWSCGVILFALVCGYLPFEDPNTSQLYKKILSADFQVPKFVSNEAKDLITCILNTDPEKRYKIDDIRKHPWFNLVKCDENFKGTIVGIDPVPIDPIILEGLNEYNINVDYAKKCLEANKHNHITATYYLLLKKHVKNGGESIADPRSPKYDPTYFLKRQPNFKNLSEANQKQPTAANNARAGSQQPTRVRRIADGLVDLERYSTIQRQRGKNNQQQQRNRAESTGGYHTIQEPSEVITSTNFKDLGYDRTPSISPSTIRVGQNRQMGFEKQNSKGGLSNTMFYHNMLIPDSTTPISSNIQTSNTPGLEMQLQMLQNYNTIENDFQLMNQKYSTLDPKSTRRNSSGTRSHNSRADSKNKHPLAIQLQNLQNQYNILLSGRPTSSQFSAHTTNRHQSLGIGDNQNYNPFQFAKQNNYYGQSGNKKKKTPNYSVNYTLNDPNYIMNALNNSTPMNNFQNEYLKYQNMGMMNQQNNLSHTLTPFDLSTIVSNRDNQSKQDDMSTLFAQGQPHPDVGISYLSKSSLNQGLTNFSNVTPTQLIAQVMSPNMFPREPKLPSHKQLISSAVRSRRYKKESSGNNSKNESPKTLFTRKQYNLSLILYSLMNLYKGSAGNNIRGKSNNFVGQIITSGESLPTNERRTAPGSKNDKHLFSNNYTGALLNNSFTPSNNYYLNTSTHLNNQQPLDFVSKLQYEQQQQQQQIKSTGQRQQSNSQSKKGFYIPNANISVVEKNPMNITIYNIRNSAGKSIDHNNKIKESEKGLGNTIEYSNPYILK